MKRCQVHAVMYVMIKLVSCLKLRYVKFYNNTKDKAYVVILIALFVKCMNRFRFVHERLFSFTFSKFLEVKFYKQHKITSIIIYDEY